MKNNTTNYIKEAVMSRKNNAVSTEAAKRFAGRILMDSIDRTPMRRDGGVIVVEDLDLVFIAIPENQQRVYEGSRTLSMTRWVNSVITTEAPKLPIPNGIYRGRRKDGSFTMIAYFNSIMVDIGCDYRTAIKVTDPFWIDLRSIKVPEFKTKEQLVKDASVELMSLADKEIKELKARNLELEAENSELKKELATLKDDAVKSFDLKKGQDHEGNDANDDFSDLADKSGW